MAEIIWRNIVGLESSTPPFFRRVMHPLVPYFLTSLTGKRGNNFKAGNCCCSRRSKNRSFELSRTRQLGNPHIPGDTTYHGGLAVTHGSTFSWWEYGAALGRGDPPE